jgi:hypothetical protein
MIEKEMVQLTQELKLASEVIASWMELLSLFVTTAENFQVFQFISFYDLVTNKLALGAVR